VIVPVWLPAPPLAATEKEIEPLPVPVAPAVIVIHETVLAATQTHAVWVMTDTLPVSPLLGTERLLGESVNVQEVLPGWLTPNVNTAAAVVPVIVMLPDCGSGEGLAATVNDTDPAPLPVAPDVMLTQLSLLTADHEQPAAVVTVRLPFPPVAGIEALAGEMEYVHVVPSRGTWNWLSRTCSSSLRSLSLFVTAAWESALLIT